MRSLIIKMICSVMLLALLAAATASYAYPPPAPGNTPRDLPGKWLNEGEQTTLLVQNDLSCVLQYLDYEEGSEVGRPMEIKGKVSVKGDKVTIKWSSGSLRGTGTVYKRHDTGKQIVLLTIGYIDQKLIPPKEGLFAFHKEGQDLPEIILMDNGDGTVTDPGSGLMWVKDPGANPDLKGAHDWDEADKLCQALKLAGYNDWRLPTLVELRTIIDRSQTPVLARPLTGESDSYWTASEASDPGAAYYINFQTGLEYAWGMFNPLLVRPVRTTHSPAD